MGDLWIVVLCFVVIVMPIWLALHYGSRYRQARLLTSESERTLVELAELADRMQSRIENLERLLDAAAPDWRHKP